MGWCAGREAIAALAWVGRSLGRGRFVDTWLAMGEAFEMRIPAGVELVRNAEPARWAIRRMDSANDPPQWKLSTFMPSGFDGYVRILHPLAERGGEGPSGPWARFASRGALPIEPDAQLRDVIGREGFDQGCWMNTRR